MPFRNLDVIDAAERAADQINALVDRPRRHRLLHAHQMRSSMQSVVANIAEAFGRGGGRTDRDRSLRIARGEAEETIQHLGANARSGRISAKEYWPIHNLLVVIVKMLNGLLNG